MKILTKPASKSAKVPQGNLINLWTSSPLTDEAVYLYKDIRSKLDEHEVQVLYDTLLDQLEDEEEENAMSRFSALLSRTG